jgi:hypothetical protein
LSNDLVEVSAAPANLEFGGFFPFAPASTSYSLVLEKVVYRTLAHWEYLVAPGKALWFVQKRVLDPPQPKRQQQKSWTEWLVSFHFSF